MRRQVLPLSAYNAGDYATALSWFEQARKNNPDDETIRHNYKTAKEVYEQQLREQERARQEIDARRALENILTNTTTSLKAFTPSKPESSTSLQYMDTAESLSRQGYFDRVGTAAFSAGSSDTAPVPMGGVSGLAARAVPLPVITPDNIAGGKAPAGAARSGQPIHLKPLLSGAAAKVRLQKARGRLAMILGDEAYTLKADYLPDARLFDSQGMLVTKAEFMLAALEYGETWQDAVKFLGDARSLYPGNTEIISAMEEIKAIFISNSKQ